MSRKKTVKLNLSIVDSLIKATFRSNVVFCEKMGRPKQKTWVTDWHRTDKEGNPTPKGLPSPEEAARMCLLLNTTPDEILTEQADIELVNGLIEQERAKQGIKKERPAQDGTLSEAESQLIDLFQKLPKEVQDSYLALLEATLKAQGLL